VDARHIPGADSSGFRSGALASCCCTFRCYIPLFEISAQIQQAKRCGAAANQKWRNNSTVSNWIGEVEDGSEMAVFKYFLFSVDRI